jgi:methionyl-tRNA formyltransferase
LIEHREMAERFSILYLGLPLGALALLRDGHDLGVACISRPGSLGMHRLRRELAQRGRLILGKPDLDDANVREVLASVKPSLLVSWFWTRRIPWDVIRLAPNAFGVHPSLLPRHRGADPYYWALANRDAETGVTAHTLTPRYDDGAILAQRKMKIADGFNAWQLARALDRPSLALMRETAGRYSRGEKISGVPQDEERASDAPAPDDEQCEILWDKPVDEVLARIRAAAPEPGAFTGYNDDTVVILRAERARSVPAALEAGEIAQTKEGVVIRAADGAIVVREARREGDERSHRGDAVLELFGGIPKL